MGAGQAGVGWRPRGPRGSPFAAFLSGQILPTCAFVVSDFTTTYPGAYPARAAPKLGPDPRSTVVLLAIMIGLFLFPQGEDQYKLANSAAIGVGLALVMGCIFELKDGLRNLFRIDVICLVGLYGLTLGEFLLPQPDLERMLTVDQTRKALDLVFLGTGSLAIGRHLIRLDAGRSQAMQLPSLSPTLLTGIAFGAFFIGHLYMFVGVNFDPFKFVHHLFGPRFGVPWGRGRYGDFRALLVEVGLISYIIPPILGMALARRKEFAPPMLFSLVLIYLITLFFAFCSGTRNIVAIHLATFSISHIFSLHKLRWWYLGLFSLAVMGVFLFLAYHMLEFRNMGLRAYMKKGVYASENVRDTLFIDFNLVSIGQLADRFPGEYHFLGLEVPIWAIIKPIPRALWPGKPTGLSLDIEMALGDSQRTVAATFIGEAYMGGGHIGVALAGLFFGALTAWWNRVAAGSQSTLSLLTYASGFYGGVICMRSMFWLTTGLLPTLALVVFGKWIYPRLFPPQGR